MMPDQPSYRRVAGFCTAVMLALFAAHAPVHAQDAPAAGDDLSVEQARLADRYERLEQVVGRLAELSASTDPRRARLLREAISRSREHDINVRFEALVKLLEDERLAVAATNQTELQKELDSLLVLLLKADRDEQIASERERIREYLKEVGRLIRLQKGVRARTEGGDDTDRLAQDQQKVADETGKLGGQIGDSESEERAPNGTDSGEEAAGGDISADADAKPVEGDASTPAETPALDGKGSEPGDSSENGESEAGETQPGEGTPSEGQPSEPGDAESSEQDGTPGEQGTPSPGSPQPGGQSGGEPSEGGQQQQQQQQQPTDRATERLRAAQQRMEQARRKLEEAERGGAADEQREALKELEQAKAELERVLRQLREEEMERTLTQLAARFRKMLEMQVAVYEGTKRLDRVPPAERGHEDEIEAARLSRQEALIVREADRAMLVLREEGSSVAFPEAVEQMRDDMQQVVERLAAFKVDAITQALEEDIIAALEETIAALEKEIKDLEQRRTPQGQMPAAGQMSEPPLVNKLAELKMIRSLQMRINLRTQRYGEMIAGEQAETPELLKALSELGDRQRRVYQATFDLGQGSND